MPARRIEEGAEVLSTELKHTFQIAAPPEEVFAHLAEPLHYVGLSPLVVAVRDVRRNGGTVNYTAVERFRFLGVLRHDNITDVTLAAVPDGLPHSAEIFGRSAARPGPHELPLRHRPPRGRQRRHRHPAPADAPGLLRFAASQAGAVQRARACVLTDRLARPV
ncbi:SRPBCC family protein [Streptomyces sp. INA 01156]